MKKIRIGSGAGYAGDRVEPSLELIEKGNLDYISYECLAERTIAIGQEAKLKDPNKGYNGLLEHRMEKALPLCWKHKVKLITNMGSANPVAAAKKCVEIAENLGLKGNLQFEIRRSDRNDPSFIRTPKDAPLPDMTGVILPPGGEKSYMFNLSKHYDLRSTGRYTVKEVAQTFGFCDPYYFSRTFKKAYGTSPSEVRYHPPGANIHRPAGR